MSLADVGITLNIQNNQSYPIQMNVLGNPFNVGGSFTTYQSQSYPRIISINQ